MTSVLLTVKKTVESRVSEYSRISEITLMFVRSSNQRNLTSQHSHLEVLILSKFGSERGDFN